MHSFKKCETIEGARKFTESPLCFQRVVYMGRQLILKGLFSESEMESGILLMVSVIEP